MMSRISLFLLFIIIGCEVDFPTSETEPDPPRQTRILDIVVTPDTISLGDTARFECIIADSLDDRFEFTWVLRYDKSVRTDSSVIYWNTENYEHTGNIQHSVMVNNYAQDSLPLSKSFTIYIKE